MEALRLTNSSENNLSIVSSSTTTLTKPFIEANTIEGSLNQIIDNHIIPVFHKDNESLISHVDFIESAQSVVQEHFKAERILSPSIRLSHPVKGRVPEARNKPAIDLLEDEKTLFYERMAFIIEIPSISDTIGGEKLSLMVGGIKAYNLDNLYGKKGTDQHFKIFCGFKVSVCTNLCIWTDGQAREVKVRDLDSLIRAVDDMVMSFDAITQLKKMEELQEYSFSESQFAQLIGKCKMYQFLNAIQKKEIPKLHLGEGQVNAICKDYYNDASFSKDENGDINLWKLYNLFTKSTKGSYIDSFLQRSVNASEIVSTLAYALKHKEDHWFLS